MHIFLYPLPCEMSEGQMRTILRYYVYNDGLQAMLCHNTPELCIQLCVPEGLSQNPVFLRNVKLSGYHFSTS